MAKQCITDRALRRQKELEDSLLVLLQSKDYAQITVTDICRQANIPRRTFYHYFSNKDEIMDSIVEDLMLSCNLRSMFDFASGVEAVRESYLRFFRFWLENREILELLIRQKLESQLILYTNKWLQTGEVLLPFPGYVDGNGVVSLSNYLALNDAERALMAYADGLKKEGKISSIIVLINTSNSLQVDFLRDYDVDACLWVGGLGISGTNAVTDILAGKVNPSGSLVDTYCYDNLSSPAMHNYIALEYANFDGQVPDQASSYMVYQEGIYVGHKYYETRYFDAVMGQGNAGDYAAQYGNEVAFTFGYGLSYTTFEYSNMTVETGLNENGEKCYNVSVTVTNTGDMGGKETVQVYLSSPYTQYDMDNKIEKAAVQLVGFGKTDFINPGESETLTIQVDERDLASYDAMMSYATDDLKETVGGEAPDPIVVNALVEAMHHNLYTIINSAAMNGMGPDTTVKVIMPSILVTARTAAMVCGVLALVFVALWVMGSMKLRKTEEYAAYKAAKAAYKASKAAYKASKKK